MTNKPKVNKAATIGSGKFLCLEQLKYEDRHGNSHLWEAANRVNSNGAVVIIALTKPENELILIKQFRPPANRYLLEFPAGLIDPGEDAIRTAHRELYEETGYSGKVVQEFGPVFNSPGLSGEAINIVLMEVDSKEFKVKPQPHLESTEDIEVILVKKAELLKFLQASQADNLGIDGKLLAYALYGC